MSYILNEPLSFAAESAEGFVAAHGTLVRRVPGGVARASAQPSGQVAVVIGGGSGHYPAFAGLVGQGLAHAAAMGNVFASPSSQQVVAAARAVSADGGVLLCYGNYAGDVLNFDQAQDRLRAAGIACRSVRVTDDICSAPADRREQRRGIAGGLAVFRVAGWAAEQGRDLASVAELAARANDRTRSIGVAFSGCTLPGAEAPLFSVPTGQMAVGVGIHGEPGIEMLPLPSADALAQLLVGRLLSELPDGVTRPDGTVWPDGGRVGVMVNGLGSVKGEELFVLYGAVARELGAAGLTIVEPEVGEYVTSFEMAGISLTLLWLDKELERAWRSPAYAPAFCKGVPMPADARAARSAGDEEQVRDAIPAAESAGSAAAAKLAAKAFLAIRDVIAREVDTLGRLDAIAGDGDHGIGMQRGSQAAALAAETAVTGRAGVGTLLELCGDAWSDSAGGTSGALWGSGLRAAGAVFGDAAVPDAELVASAVAAAHAAVVAHGQAQLGDKTLVDALAPFADSLRRRARDGAGTAEAWVGAARDATAAARATADLVPRLGRARTHVEKSVGTPDPGAISLALAMTAIGGVLVSDTEGEARE